MVEETNSNIAFTRVQRHVSKTILYILRDTLVQKDILDHENAAHRQRRETRNGERLSRNEPDIA